jgi:hypothetical protein
LANKINPQLRPFFEKVGFLPGEAELRTSGRALLDFVREIDPVQGIHRGMAASGRAFDPELPVDERRAAAIEAALETAGPLVGIGAGRLAMQPAKRILIENLTLGGAPDVEDVYAGLDDLTWTPEPEPMLPVQPVDPDIVEQVPFNLGADTFGTGMPDGFEDFTDEWDGVEPLLDAPYHVPPVRADLVSTVGRAVFSLEQPRYGSYEEVLANLRRLGAKNPEIEMSGIRSLEGVQGPITQDMIQQAISEDAGLVVRRLGAGSGVYPEYGPYFTPGGQNYREVVISLPTDPW